MPIEDTIGAIADLVKAGYVRHIALSEVGAETMRRAAAAHPIVDLQIGYSLLERRLEGNLLDACHALGIAVTAYGVLARGLLGGHLNSDLPPEGCRNFSARFRERTCAATSILPNGCVRSQLLCTRPPHRRRSRGSPRRAGISSR